MKSGGGSSSPRNKAPSPPAEMILGQGKTGVANPNYTSYLPSDPTQMATGLTPEMVASITASQAPPAVAANPVAAAPAAATRSNQLTPQEAFLFKLTGGRMLPPGVDETEARRQALIAMFAGGLRGGNR